MENAKNNRMIIYLVCFFALVSIGVNAYQYKRILDVTQGKLDKNIIGNEMSVDKAPTVSENTYQDAPAFDETKSANKKAEELKYQIAAAKEELDMLNKALADDAAKKAKEEEERLEAIEKSREISKKYQENPAYKKMIRNSMKNSMATQYADLFKILNLSDEEIDKFKDLLVDESMARQELWSEMRTDDYSSLSEEEQEELRERSEAIDKDYEAKKAELLGDDVEQYQRYLETQGERYNVNNFITSLGSGESLTDTQKEDLIEAIHEEAMNIQYEPIVSETSGAPTQDEILTRQMERQTSRNEAYLNAARGILSVTQCEKLEEYLDKELEKSMLIMEMSILETEEETAE